MMNFHEERHRSSHTRVFLPPVTVSTRTCINYYSLEVQQLAPENKPSQKDRIIFQASFLGGKNRC